MISKYIPGLLIGVALTSAAFLLLNRSDDDMDPASNEMMNSDTESQSTGADGSQLRSDSSDGNVPVETVAQSSELLNDDGENSSRDNGAVSDAALPPPVLPISLPPELEYVGEFKAFEQFERTLIDPDWSPQAEANLSNYFAQHPEITDIYGMPTIHCRETACVAMFISYGYLAHAQNHPDPTLAEYAETLFGPMEIFRADNQGFFDDPFADQFSDSIGVTADGRLEDGLATFYWTLARKAAD